MASLGDILSALLNGVQAVNGLTTQLRDSFPPITDLSTSMSAGTVTFTSSQASTFGLVQTSSGGSYRIPLYPSS